MNGRLSHKEYISLIKGIKPADIQVANIDRAANMDLLSGENRPLAGAIVANAAELPEDMSAAEAYSRAWGDVLSALMNGVVELESSELKLI